jgi:hypothetical protein
LKWAAWQRHRVRGFVLSGRESQSPQESLEIVEGRWLQIKQITVERPNGPWRYRLTKSRLTEQNLTHPGDL